MMKRMVLAMCAAWILALAAAGAAGGEPLAEVRRCDELRAQKTIRVGDDWEIQCGWSESGENGGPWVLVHVYAKRVGKEDGEKKTDVVTTERGGEEPLGPVWLHSTFGDKKIVEADVKEAGYPKLSGENVYCGGADGPQGEVHN